LTNYLISSIILLTKGGKEMDKQNKNSVKDWFIKFLTELASGTLLFVIEKIIERLFF